MSIFNAAILSLSSTYPHEQKWVLTDKDFSIFLPQLKKSWLVDALEYTSSQILALYNSRWDAQVNLRHIKKTLGMDILSCQTPEMARKEIYIYLLAYNLLMSVMYNAAMTSRLNPIRFSLQATRQHLNNFTPIWFVSTQVRRSTIAGILLEKVSLSYQKKRVGSR